MRIIKHVFILLCLCLVFAICHRKNQDNYLKTEQLYELFQNPESQYHPFVRWWWNGDKVESDELVREMELLKEAGIGGVEINPVAFPSYCDSIGKESLQWLSPEWIDMLKVCFDKAKELNMTCDLIVGSGWPFGAEILEGEERAQIVVNYAEPVTGPCTLTINRDSIFEKSMPKVSSPYKGNVKELMQLKLYPNPVSDITQGIDVLQTDSIFTIEVPEGEYTLASLVKITGFLEVINGAPGAAGPVLNHFDTEAVNKYLYNMSDSIEGRIGPLRDNIRALFTDSMELEGANWTSDMADEFEKRYGYKLTDYLPFILFKIGSMGSALNYDAVVPVTEKMNEKVQRARYDFEDFKAQLMKERFTETYLTWCHNLGVKARAQAYGRGFYPLENAMGYDIPEGESWTTNWLRHKPGEEMAESDYRRGRAYTMVNKFVSSAAHLAGNRMMSCEEMTNTYTVFNMTLEQLKLGGDQTAISGVTHSVFHGFNYSPNKEVAFPGWLRYGAFYSENNNWWPYFKYYNEYKARLATALQHGTYYTDIAILNPENDMWSTIGMQNEPFPNVTRAPYKTFIWEAINKCGGGVDYVTENIINDAQVKKGNVCYNARKYNTLFVIDVESMHPETSEKLLQFAKQGGKVICIDTIPYKSLGLSGNVAEKDSIVKANIEKMMQFKDNFVFVEPPKEGFLPWYDSLMKAEQLPHYLDIESPDLYVMQNRYTTDDGSEMLFISNSNRYDAHETKITFSREITKGKHPWIWDLQTGQRFKLPLDDDGSYNFNLGPVESLLIVFEKPHYREEKPQIWQPLQQIIGVDCRAKGHCSEGNTNLNVNDLSNDWMVELRHSRTDTIMETHFDTLTDLKELEDYKHFTGTIVYKKSFELYEISRTILNLGTVEGVAEVFINGQSAGVRYFGRCLFDISDFVKEGNNEIEIHVVTTMGNYMKTMTDNLVAKIYVNRKGREQEYQPMGMLGPVKVYF